MPVQEQSRSMSCGVATGRSQAPRRCKSPQCSSYVDFTKSTSRRKTGSTLRLGLCCCVSAAARLWRYAFMMTPSSHMGHFDARKASSMMTTPAQRGTAHVLAACIGDSCVAQEAFAGTTQQGPSAAAVRICLFRRRAGPTNPQPKEQNVRVLLI